MPNDYFRFKQFTVQQDKCAMKVCTDACLFGSLLPTSSKGGGVENVLDIGAGTGLLSLMYAQKNPDTMIDAVEIDEAAAGQAKENFDASPWKERLHVYNDSVQQFAETTNNRYDVVISNPPFYESSLKSDNAKRNLALHSKELRLDELITVADKLMNIDGNFFLLLPYHRTGDLQELITGRLFIKQKIFMKQTPKHNYFRSMFWLTKQFTGERQSEIIIMNDRNEYSDLFKGLLKDYYLAL
jgi:tRNA1Val (adenine37-N6)-methyltransferase